MRAIRPIAGAALVMLTAAACTSGGGPAATSSAPAPTSASPSASPTTSTPAPATSSASVTPSEEPTPGPSSTLPPELAAYQLCGTVLALAAGFVGQVAPEQLDEGMAVAKQARADYVDDGSGLAQKADAVIDAVEFADQTKVVPASKALAEACKSVDPGT